MEIDDYVNTPDGYAKIIATEGLSPNRVFLTELTGGATTGYIYYKRSSREDETTVNKYKEILCKQVNLISDSSLNNKLVDRLNEDFMFVEELINVSLSNSYSVSDIKEIAKEIYRITILNSQ
jgi:hypothetical protein